MQHPLTSKEAGRFANQFMNLFYRIFVCNRERPYSDAVKIVLKSGLAKDKAGATKLLENLIGLDSPVFGLNERFKLNKITDNKGNTKIKMELYAPVYVGLYESP